MKRVFVDEARDAARPTWLFLALLSLLACGPDASPRPAQRPAPAPAAAPPAGQSLQHQAGVVNAALDYLLGQSPGWGRSLGLHQYDGKVAQYSKEAIETRIEGLRQLRATLDALPQPAPSPDLALDLALLRGDIELTTFNLVEQDAWRKNPLFYEGLFAVNDYLDRDYAPIEERARQLVAHEEAALLEVGQVLQNLVSPLPRPIVETAVKVYAGYASYLRTDVVRSLKGVGDPAFQQRFAATNGALAGEAEAIARHLQRVELPRSDDGYALGAERYAKFVAIQEGLTLPLSEFASMAEADLAANKRAYAELAKSVTQTRPRAKDLLGEASRVTLEARTFITQHGLASMPDEPAPVVRETPPFMRWNQAFLVSPGPFEKAGLAAYYYITLPDRTWNKQKQHEYLMTRGTLVSTTVHETYPGHFLQGLWSRRAPTRVQKAIGAYSFTEGWAHYVEQLMVEAGFGGERPETRLGQLSDALLRNCRFVASIGMHAQGMTLQEAERRFVQDCFQDQASAHEQAVRGTFDPGYFAYTLGKLQILALREEAQRKLGAGFSLQRFHDALLSHGSPPIPLIRERVLAELAASTGAAAP
jgi:hypothetical protein